MQPTKDGEGVGEPAPSDQAADSPATLYEAATDLSQPLTDSQARYSVEQQSLMTDSIARMSRTWWQPGVSGNPLGRPPKGKSWRELAASRPEHRKLAVIMAQEERALEGSTKAAEFLRDTAEGKPAVTVITNASDTDSPIVSILRSLQLEITSGIPVEKQLEIREEEQA